MKNVWNIFKQDVRNIKRVPLVGLLLLGLAILPALYAWFNLGSAWDPYANTENIRIAVVNEDEGTKIEGEQVNIGEEIVENLKENEDLGWQFISKQEAEDKVEHGDIYAAIYMEDSFSNDLAKVLDGEPQQTEVLYKVNEKINAIAPQMTSAGATAIVSEMNDQFIEVTSETLFEQFDKLGIRMEEELPTMRKVKNIVDELNEQFPKMNQFADRLMKVEENWDQIDDQVEQFLELEDYFPEINQGVEMIYRLEEQFPTINQLGAEVQKLEDFIPELEASVEDLSTVGERYSEIREQLEKSLEKAKVAEENMHDIQEAIPTLLENREIAEEYMESMQAFLEEASETTDSMDAIITQQLQFINQTAKMTDQVLANLEDEEAMSESLESIATLNDQLTNHILVVEQTIELYKLLGENGKNENASEIANDLIRLQENMESLQKALDSIQSELDNGNINAEDIATARQRAEEAEDVSRTLINLLSQESEPTLYTAFMNLTNNLEQSDSELHDAYAKVDTLGKTLSQAEDVIDTSEKTLENLLEALPDMEGRVNEMIGSIESELPKFVTTIETLAEFVEQDLPQIEEHVQSIADVVREDLPELQDRYQHISSILVEEVPRVKEALSEINHFSSTYLPEFGEVIYETADQFNRIDEEDQISELIAALRNDLNEESDFFANPVDLKEESLFEIPNYGSANAPFYTALSIWVGALLLSNLITTNVHPVDRKEDYTLRQIYFGKLILFLIVGVLQGFIVSVGNLQLLGVYAKHPVLFVIFSMFISVIFMTIVYTLASILGNIGKAVAIVLLVLQLSSSGGTFPIDVAPPFFQAIHPFMPFTYAIDLLREAIGGAIPTLVLKNSIVLLLFMGLAFLIGLVLKPLLAKRIEETIEKSKSSRMVE